MVQRKRELRLPNYDSIFGEDENSAVQEIRLEELYPFKKHPFQVKDDAAMMELVESIKIQGVIMPALAREREQGGYEIVYGHRRKRACELAGLQTMPVVIKELTDKDAIDIMVDSNIQRPEILPSEKAFAYEMKYREVSKRGSRTDLTSCQVGMKLIKENEGESIRTIQRYISLTKLIPEFLEYVDSKKMALTVGVELATLKNQEQELLLEVMNDKKVVPTGNEVEKIKEYSRRQELTKGIIEIILERDKFSKKKITLKSEKLEQYFPKSFSETEKEELIYSLLEEWKRKNMDPNNS